jgi:hypothetical protein
VNDCIPGTTQALWATLLEENTNKWPFLVQKLMNCAHFTKSKTIHPKL